MQSIREPYRAWAENHVQRIKDLLNASRSEHTQAVKDRIASVEQMKDVVAVTEGLFALSKVRARSPFFPFPSASPLCWRPSPPPTRAGL